MRAYDIIGDKVTFSPEFLAVPEFNAIWNRDKTKNKGKAMKELSFIVFLCDERSHNPYIGYSEDLREEILLEDMLENDPTKIDDKIISGIEKLKQLLQTTSSRLLASAQIAADKLAGWFKQVDFNMLDDNGKLLYSASELSRNLKDVGNIIKSLKQLEKQVQLEQLEEGTARGGAEIGMFEIPT